VDLIDLVQDGAGGGAGWVQVAVQGGGKWLALINTVTGLQFA